MSTVKRAEFLQRVSASIIIVILIADQYLPKELYYGMIAAADLSLSASVYLRLRMLEHRPNAIVLCAALPLAGMGICFAIISGFRYVSNSYISHDAMLRVYQLEYLAAGIAIGGVAFLGRYSSTVILLPSRVLSVLGVAASLLVPQRPFIASLIAGGALVIALLWQTVIDGLKADNKWRDASSGIKLPEE